MTTPSIPPLPPSNPADDDTGIDHGAEVDHDDMDNEAVPSAELNLDAEQISNTAPIIEEGLQPQRRRRMTPEQIKQAKRRHRRTVLLRRSGYIIVALLYLAAIGTGVWWVFAIR
ncbi:hypothetical protein [Bifidobacterium oedipodis]|uniref:Transmembrane protein n=1 Tax=Bifidobacterium oedipodis TaxID=2675322 RepID=A0A7Y0EP03_9BIFI|nr:hypothetical protein [Bifidobacterium sp. DSM 109957]NMM93809.1 hypothetical protein [Bifidobacterium sp. DSM 109957]